MLQSIYTQLGKVLRTELNSFYVALEVWGERCLLRTDRRPAQNHPHSLTSRPLASMARLCEILARAAAGLRRASEETLLSIHVLQYRYSRTSVLSISILVLLMTRPLTPPWSLPRASPLTQTAGWLAVAELTHALCALTLPLSHHPIEQRSIACSTEPDQIDAQGGSPTGTNDGRGRDVP